eukprot:6795226-Pyramimonas_sp.AAC.1
MRHRQSLTCTLATMKDIKPCCEKKRRQSSERYVKKINSEIWNIMKNGNEIRFSWSTRTCCKT